MLNYLFFLFITLTISKYDNLVSSAPKTWPYMKTYDIWGMNETDGVNSNLPKTNHIFNETLFSHDSLSKAKSRKAKGEMLFDTIS